jgi:hypothetical protein
VGGRVRAMRATSAMGTSNTSTSLGATPCGASSAHSRPERPHDPAQIQVSIVVSQVPYELQLKVMPG